MSEECAAAIRSLTGIREAMEHVIEGPAWSWLLMRYHFFFFFFFLFLWLDVDVDVDVDADAVLSPSLRRQHAIVCCLLFSPWLLLEVILNTRSSLSVQPTYNTVLLST